MFVYYVKKFDGTMSIRTISKRPPNQPIEGQIPLHVQEVLNPAAFNLPLSELERLYPPPGGSPGQ